MTGFTEAEQERLRTLRQRFAEAPEAPGDPADTLPVEPEPLPQVSQIRLADKLRPSRLDEIIGQDIIKSTLPVYIRGALRRNRSLGHCLFYGPAGLGKTTFASAIATEMGHNLIQMDGPRLKGDELTLIVSRIIGSDTDIPVVLFVDEIHATPKDAMTQLLPLLEDFKWSGIHVPQFTLVGATTDPHKLLTPLRARFQHQYQLEYYSVEQIEEIIARNIAILWEWSTDYVGDVLSTTDGRRALRAIALRANGVPRIANQLLEKMLNFSLDIDPELKPFSTEAFNTLVMAERIDIHGLTPADRDVLVAMLIRFKNKPVGIRALASTLGIDYTTYEGIIEPTLVRLGLINRLQRGRELTTKGQEIAALASVGQVQYIADE